EEDPNEEHKPEDTREPSEDSDETEPFEEDKTVVTPPPPRHHGARMSVRPQTPMVASTQALIDAFVVGSSPFPLPPISPAYDQAPLGYRTAMICRRDDIPEEDMPPKRRFSFTAPSPGCDIAESSAATARAPRSQVVDRAKEVGYVRALQAFERRMMNSIEEVNLRVSYQAQVRKQESKIMPVTRQGTNDAMTPESIQVMIDQVIQRNSTHTQNDASRSLGRGLRRPVQLACICSYTDFMKCQSLNFKGTEGVVGLSQRLKKIESVFHINGCAIDNQVKFATFTLLGVALTWWNGHVRTLGHEATYAMT
nr:reverse transcriptase domain-containing protein [Tanacetum cinerariifolium]